MNISLLMLAVVAVVMLKRITDMYLGGHYVCPSCGARARDTHATDCPWSSGDID